jgi:mono/diheme cytochrome c family protein
MRSLLVLLLALAGAATAHAQGAAPDRGQLLYSTHCVECHTTQMHWREQRLARDWGTLKDQVRRFQGIARPGWSDDDIDAVARHLNDTIYRFPQSQARR